MCGYCTEHFALQIAAQQRQQAVLSDEDKQDGGAIVFQEFDRLLVEPSCETFLDDFVVGKDGDLHTYAAHLLLARKIISQSMGLVDFTPRASFWLDKAEQLIGTSPHWLQAPKKDYLAQRFRLLHEYIECSIVSLTEDVVAKDGEAARFDVLVHLPVLVEAILLLEAGHGSVDEQSLLFNLASGYLRSGVPDFYSVELWLQRLAVCALWRRQGLDSMRELIARHTRPLLFWYLHERLGLSAGDRAVIADWLVEKGQYDSPLGEYEWVVEQLQSE